MTEEEKVCLTGDQIENIAKAWAAENGRPAKKDVCPKALNWVQKYYGKKKTKQEKQIDAGEQLMRMAERILRGKIGRWVDGMF